MTNAHTYTRRRPGLLVILALGVLLISAAISAAGASTASASVEWKSELYTAPSHLQPGQRGVIRLFVENAGDSASDGFPTVSFELPDGISIAEPSNSFFFGWQCSGTPLVTCTMGPLASLLGVTGVQPATYSKIGSSALIHVFVEVDPGATEGVFPLQVSLSNPDDTSVNTFPVEIDSSAAPFGPRPGFFSRSLDQAGADDTQAGDHPYRLTTSFEWNTRFDDPGTSTSVPPQRASIRSQGEPRDVVADLPAGVAADPTAVPRCKSLGQVTDAACPPSSQVGVVWIAPPVSTGGSLRGYGVYNVKSPTGSPGQLAFRSPVGTQIVRPVLRSNGDWGISAQVRSLTQIDALLSTRMEIWGVPADPSHDIQRCAQPNVIAEACVGYDELGEPPASGLEERMAPHEAGAPRLPFLSNPTRCDGQPLVSLLHLSRWEAPVRFEPDGDADLSDPNWAHSSFSSPPMTGCESLDFAPTIKARPTTSAADSPSGLDVDLHIPQNMDPDGLATAQLRKAVVQLPEGLVINPSSANGLGACSPAQIHLGDHLSDNCPDAARIGDVEVVTPALDDPLPGSVFVATPHDNPFDSLLAIYVVIDDPESGIVGKLAGKITPNPVTGRLTATFDDNPQVPFEDFKLDFFGGAAASLRTPATCGTYSTVSELTPWSAPQSGPPATPKDTYAISQGAGGKACGPLLNDPSFEAGSTSPLAGKHSPFVVDIRRADGTQELSKLTVTPPPGLVAKLAGTPPCSDAALAAAERKDGRAEQASPSCPAASAVGTVTVGAGAGPAPYYVQGKAYLAGPYKGAPLSLAVVTPAVAGPYDLGTVVVRAALALDPKNAQITAASDPLPRILQGIPLDLRSVQIKLDKPEFTLNPTSCDETKVEGSLLTTTGAAAQLASRFQLGECGRLHLKPKLTLRLKGATRRRGYPALTAVLRPRPGDANLETVSVAFPHSEFLAQNHLDNVCTRVQFAADECPKGSVYGSAVVTTPLLDYKLRGPVYLRSNPEHELPDLVPDLRGPAWQPIRLEAAGRTDSVHEGIRNSFEGIPDAPFTKLVLRMRGGRHGLLENSAEDICRGTRRVTVNYAAHNGLTARARPELKVAGCGKKAGGKGKKGGRR